MNTVSSPQASWKPSAWSVTTLWSVTFQLAPAAGSAAVLPVPVLAIKSLLDVLEDRSPVARSDAEELRITFDTTGELESAVADAKESLYSALCLANLGGFEIVSASIIDHVDFDKQRRESEAPRFLSVTETAVRLGVSKQRVSQMVRERKDLVPDCYVGGAPGFRESTVLRILARRSTAKLP